MTFSLSLEIYNIPSNLCSNQSNANLQIMLTRCSHQSHIIVTRSWYTPKIKFFILSIFIWTIHRLKLQTIGWKINRGLCENKFQLLNGNPMQQKKSWTLKFVHKWNPSAQTYSGACLKSLLCAFIFTWLAIKPITLIYITLMVCVPCMANSS